MQRFSGLVALAVLALAACDGAAPEVPDARVAALTATSGRRAIDRSAREVLLANRIVTAPEGAVALPDALAAAEPGLFVVHFAGPIQGAWQDGLGRAGLVVLDYVPANAYVVYGDGAALSRVVNRTGAVDLVTPFELSDKRSPLLTLPEVAGEALDVTLMVVDHPGARATLDALDDATLEVRTHDRVHRHLHVLGRTIDASALPALLARPDVYWVEPWLEPELDDEAQDQILAGAITGTAPTGPGYRAWFDALGLEGLDDVIVDVSDTGFDTGVLTGAHHPDLEGRFAFCNNFVTSETGCDDGGGHGTINAAIVGGDATHGTGVTDPAGYLYGEGVAPGVRFGSSTIFSNSGYWGAGSLSGDDFIKAAWQSGARISTNSWGSHAYGSYTATSQEFDALVRDADGDHGNGNQPMIVFFSAGNDGSGSYSIGAPATGKNVISVGASENYRMNGSDGCGISNSGADGVNDLIYFSSRGPTRDGRLKPEIVAPGTHVQGAASTLGSYSGNSVCDKYWPSGQTRYARSSGTSHSCPAAAGAGAMLYAWVNEREGQPPSPALMKAMLVAHTADMAGGASGASGVLAHRPGNDQGFGRLDLSSAFDASVERVIVDQTTRLQETGQAWELSPLRAVDPTRPVLVVLAWTDAPGATSGAAYNNDLDLEVSGGSNVWLGNVLADGWSVTGGQRDLRNNVEAVFLAPASVSSFSLRVLAANLPSDGVPGDDDDTDQDFALYLVNATSQSPTGMVAFEDLVTSCTSSVEVTVSDQDLQGAGTVQVTVSSPLEPAGETLTLAEVEPATGVFRGTVALQPTPSLPGDGKLYVVDGDALAALYLDADDGTGRQAEARAEAALDCRAPRVYGLAFERKVKEIRVSWRTDEPSPTTLVYAFGSGSDLTLATDALTTEHAVSVTPLPDCKDLRVQFGVVDRFGNAGVDDNNGQRYHLGTGQQSASLYAMLDTNPAWETTGSWALGVPTATCSDPGAARTGLYVYGTNLAGCYGAGANDMLTTPVFTLVDTPALELSYSRWVTVETGWDFAEVQLGEGSKWTTLWSTKNRGTVKDTAWVDERLDLAAWAGKQVRLRWSLTSDSNTNYGGWNLDDVAVLGRVSCTAENKAPTCVLNATPRVGVVPLTTQLSASGSFDADGTIVRTLWDFGDGAFGEGAAVAHAYAKRGTYKARATLVDDDGAVSSCTIEIKANEAPRACFLADAELIQQGDDVRFDARCSSDVDGGVTSYAWSFGDGMVGTGVNPVHVYPTAGVYTVTLTVTDSDGAQVAATPQVVSVNAPPTADLEWFPIVPQVNEVVRFDADGSVDPDGQVKNWAWTFGDGAVEEDTSVPLHVYGDPGRYTVSLEIIDNWGGHATLSREVRVNAPPMAVFAASPAGAVQQGDQVAFDASQSRDLDGALAELAWDFGDGDVDQGALVTHTFLCPGSFSVRLDAVDDDGASDRAERLVQVKNLPPQVTLAVGLEAVEGTALLLDADVVEICPESPLAYVWKTGDGAFATTPFVSHAWADDGTYTVEMCVRDPQNASGCANAEVTVSNAAPVVDAGPDVTTTQGAIVAFSGVFSDKGSLDTHTVSWEFGDGATASGWLTPLHGYATVGSLVARLQVVDDDGGVGTDTLVVNVQNALPVVDAGPDRSAKEGQQLVLTATASDPGGDALDLVWDFGDGGSATGPGPHPHTWADNGLYAVTVRATDANGGVSTDTALVSVTNVAPLAEAGASMLAVEGDLLRFEGTASDASALDTLVSAWYFGDGAQAATRVADHAYRDNGSYTATFTVTDDDGAVSSDVLDVTIANAPPVAVAGGDATLDEGSAARFWGQASDPGAADVLTLGWSFGDGATAQGVTQVEHVYRDDGDWIVTFTVSDDDGAAASDEQAVQVRNVAPLAEAGPDRAAREGEPVTLAGGFTDPGLDDTQAVRWDFGDAGSIEGQVAPVHAWACAGSFQARLTVTDDDGGVGQDSTTVTIANVAPTLDAGKDRAVVEGAELVFGATVSDPCPAGVPDAAAALWDFGDGATVAGLLSPAHRFDDDGTFAVSVTLPDPSGGVVTDALIVTVSNASPAVEAGPDAAADEGAPVAFAGSYADAGASDQHLVAWHFGDGEGASTAVASHAYADEGTYTATLEVSDDDGGAGSDHRTIMVQNLPPQVEAGADLAAFEGAQVTLQGVLDDPGVHDVVSARWDFGDGVTAIGALATHAWADDGTYEVRLTGQDEDGGAASDTLVAQVANLPPAVSAGPDRLVAQGEPVLLAGTATDPGLHDVLALRWAFGDGATADGLEAPVHAWSSPGVFEVTLTATDDDGAEASDTARVTVTNAPPAVSLASVPPTREGSPVTLSATAVDPGGEPPTLSWDFGDGTQQPGASTVTHTYADNGTYAACVQAADPQGASARACVDVVVTNAPPTIASVPLATATEDSPYIYDVVASDAAGALDPLTYWLDTRPAGMALDALTGRLAWTPSDADVCGAHPVLVRVQDDDGGQAYQSFALTVANVDDAPLITSLAPAGATQGYPWTYAPKALDADVAAGCLGDALTWSLLEGPAGMGLDPATGLLTWVPGNLDVGVHTLLVGVADATGLSDVQEIEVSVAADPRAPVALAGADREVEAGVVVLDGSASWPSGTLAGWEWTLLSGPVELDLGGCAEAICPVTLLARGPYVFRLVVTDLGGHASPPDDVTITVANVAPLADAGFARVVQVGTPVQLDAGASTDLNGDPLTAAWDVLDAPEGSEATVVVSAAGEATLTPDRVGAYGLGLRVFDGQDGSDVVRVELMGVNPLSPDYPPVAMVVPAALEVPVGAPVTLDGSASHDPESVPVTYAWAAIASPEPLVLEPADGPTVTFTPGVPGVYRLGLVVHAKGASSWRAEAQVLVQGEAPLPLADAGVDLLVPVGALGTLDGGASVVAGVDLPRFAWRQVGGGRVTLDDPAAVTPTFRSFRPGRADLEVSVSTSEGLAGVPDRVAVFQVTGSNRPPTPVATAPALAWAWDAVALDGGSSLDPDGDPLAFAWVQTAGPASLVADWRAPVTTFVPPAWGEIRFALVVTDGEVQAAPVEVTVRVASANNKPPEADAGPDLEGIPGVPVTLDGTGSHDPEGAPLTWRWTQVGGPAVALAGAEGPNPGFVAEQVGSYRFALVVADLLFESSVDEALVEVREPGPEPEPEASDVDATTPDEVEVEPVAEVVEEAMAPEPQPDLPAEPQPEPAQDVAEPSPDGKEPVEIVGPQPEAEPDVTIPLDVMGRDVAEVQAEPEESGGGGGCAMGGSALPGAWVAFLAGLGLAVAMRRRRTEG